jgi:uncharacterized protein YecE (DUF72 family)
MPSKTYIGTSGWNYKKWREDFYCDIPQKHWLRFCAERFTSIEVNSTFYRLQSQSTFEKWRDETPEGFPFAIKGHRYVTHNKKLIDVEEPVIRCRDAASPLAKRLAAVVWQLPAFLKRMSSDWRNSCKRCGTGKAHGTRSSFATKRGSMTR